MNKLPYVLCGDTLTVVFNNGESHTIRKDHTNFNSVLQAIRDESWDLIPDLMSPKAAVKSFSHGHFEVVDGEVRIDGEAVPELLQNKILEYMENGLPYEPIVNFWVNLNENPSFRAVTQLYGFLLKYNHALTEDGCFIAYKKVRENFTDCRTGTISNEVGMLVSIPRNKVDENPEVTCSHGLHVACYEYANTFYGGGGYLLMVKVNPKDVVAIPVDCNEGKIRVCEYEVLSLVECEDKSALYRTERPGPGCSECDCCDCDGDCDDEDHEAYPDDPYDYDPYNDGNDM